MFFDLPDPRAGNAHHRLGDLMFIALAASLCGAQSALNFAQFAHSKQAPPITAPNPAAKAARIAHPLTPVFGTLGSVTYISEQSVSV